MNKYNFLFKILSLLTIYLSLLVINKGRAIGAILVAENRIDLQTTNRANNSDNSEQNQKLLDEYSIVELLASNFQTADLVTFLNNTAHDREQTLEEIIDLPINISLTSKILSEEKLLNKLADSLGQLKLNGSDRQARFSTQSTVSILPQTKDGNVYQNIYDFEISLTEQFIQKEPLFSANLSDRQSIANKSDLVPDYLSESFNGDNILLSNHNYLHNNYSAFLATKYRASNNTFKSTIGLFEREIHISPIFNYFSNSNNNFIARIIPELRLQQVTNDREFESNLSLAAVKIQTHQIPNYRQSSTNSLPKTKEQETIDKLIKGQLKQYKKQQKKLRKRIEKIRKQQQRKREKEEERLKKQREFKLRQEKQQQQRHQQKLTDSFLK